jgi:hypothetical protein
MINYAIHTLLNYDPNPHLACDASDGSETCGSCLDDGRNCCFVEVMEPITNVHSTNLGGGAIFTVTEVIYPPDHNRVAIILIVIAGIAIFGAWLWFSRRKNSN